MSIATVASTGMRAASRQLDATASNIARAQVPGAQRLRVDTQALPDGAGVSTQLRQEPAAPELTQELPDAMAATYTFQANLKALRAEDAMLGTLLDTRT